MRRRTFPLKNVTYIWKHIVPKSIFLHFIFAATFGFWKRTENENKSVEKRPLVTIIKEFGLGKKVHKFEKKLETV